jgi:hypothetical protein
MLHRTLLFLLLLAYSTAAVQAQYSKPSVPQSGSQARSQTTCPWLTQGSASRALGGDVSTKVSVSDTGEGSCRFLREQRSPDSLMILVSKDALTSCPTESTKLKGIGNQAARCRAPGSHSKGVEMVSGRVRDLHFTVTLTSRGQKSPVKLPDVQEDALEQIAEQIAGNLY